MPTTPRTTLRKKPAQEKSKMPAILLMVGAAILIVGALTLIGHKYFGFRAQADNYGPFIHKIGEPDFAPPPEIWSETSIARYNDRGVGIQPISFIKVLPNGQRLERKFELEKWNRYQEEGDNPKRRAKVREAHERFSDLVTWLNTRESMHRKVLWITDVTGGISGPDHKLINERLASLKLDESVTGGDPVDFRGCFISDSRFETCQQVSIKSRETGKMSDLRALEQSLSAERGTTKDTSLYQGLINVITPLVQSGDTPDEIHIFTDAVENDQDIGLSFYKMAPVTPEQYSDLLGKIESSRGKKFPALNNVRVFLYGPRRGTGLERRRIDAALDFAVWVFGQRSAHVEKFYE